MTTNRLFSIALISVCFGCGPTAIPERNENTGDITFLGRADEVLWSRENLPRWKVLAFDSKNDGFNLDSRVEKMKVQAGKIGASPVPYWDILASTSSLQLISNNLKLQKTAFMGKSIDEDPEDSEALASFGAIDDFPVTDIYNFQYAAYSPAPKTFELPSPGVKDWEDLRVYDRGSCSIFSSWSSISGKIADGILDTAACQAECGGNENFWWSLYTLEKNDFLNYAARDAFGFFPIFKRVPGGANFGLASDSFGFYGYYTIHTYIGPNHAFGIFAEYKMTAENGDVKVVASPPKVKVTHKGDLNGIVQGFSTTTPSLIASTINSVDCVTDSDGCRKIRLPGFFIASACTNAGKKSPCDLPIPCTQGPNASAKCATDVRASLELGSGVLLGASSQSEKDRYITDVHDEDFSCENETDPKSGGDPTKIESFCVYKVPFGRVNNYPDGFELVIREPEKSGYYGVIHAYSLIEFALMEKQKAAGEEVKAPKAIPFCKGRFFGDYQPRRNFYFEKAPHAEKDVDSCGCDD